MSVSRGGSVSRIPSRWTHAGLAVAGLALFEVSRLLARRRRIDLLEERIFRAANEADDRLRVPVWSIMQAGGFGTVPAVAGVLVIAGRRRLAVEAAVGGTAAWVLAKAAKQLGGRPRPGRLLSDVRIRERIGGDLGWLSGHTAIATTLALTLAPVAPPPARVVLTGVVATTAFGRMYVGAHLPLDLVGGVGLGMMIAAAVRTIGQEVLPIDAGRNGAS
jgi:glycosyltransferase 2 family protein